MVLDQLKEKIDSLINAIENGKRVFLEFTKISSNISDALLK